MSFKDLIKKLDKAKSKQKEFITEFRSAVAVNVINWTPVDTGQARANWNASTGLPDDKFVKGASDKAAGPAPAYGDGPTIQKARAKAIRWR